MLICYCNKLLFYLIWLASWNSAKEEEPSRLKINWFYNDRYTMLGTFAMMILIGALIVVAFIALYLKKTQSRPSEENLKAKGKKRRKRKKRAKKRSKSELNG